MTKERRQQCNLKQQTYPSPTIYIGVNPKLIKSFIR